MTSPQTRCGFVAVLGLANAGKSTLVNTLVGSKVSIVTPKAQTTRNRIMGIYMEEETQVVLMDTPGIFTPKRSLDKLMVKHAWNTLPDGDIALLIVDATHRNMEPSFEILERMKGQGIPVALVLNKVDKIPTPQLLPIVDKWKEYEPDHVFLISALKNQGTKELKEFIRNSLPLGPWQFPEDQLSDLPLRHLASEITREQVFYQLDQELPYQIAVMTESWENLPDGAVEIHQVIYVERDGQKGIVVGNKGSKIKNIGLKARRELERLLDHKVHLYLHVKVNAKWSLTPEFLDEMGLRDS